MSNWFEDWFVSDDYLKVYPHRNEEEAAKLIDLITNTLPMGNINTVLDLACGNGRHSLLLARKGLKVTGVDLSSSLLEKAASAAKEANMEICFLHLDVRKLNFHKEYDLVANLFTSWGYFESDFENSLVFSLVADSLKDNGYFVIDFFNKHLVIKNLVPVSERFSGDLRITEKRSIVDGRIVKKIELKDKNRYNEFFESVKLYSKDEIVAMAGKANLIPTNIFGNYEGDVYSDNESDRVIIVFQKH